MATKIDSGLKNIVVAVKQVPDTNQVRIDPETGTLIQEGVPFIVNPFDTHALEAGLQLKDRFGGQVIAISMGPPNTVMTLRKCLALGADQAILVSNRMFGGADTLATSYVLTEAVKRIELENGRIDVIICGKQTIDGDTAQVGPGLATRLGFAQLTLVDQIIDFSPVGMDQALSADEQYFSGFYEDLAKARFALIVSEPLKVKLQGSEYSFGEENDAWVKWVSRPILCYYEPIATFKRVRVELLKPRENPVDCP